MAMTGAERQRRRMEKLRGAAAVGAAASTLAAECQAMRVAVAAATKDAAGARERAMLWEEAARGLARTVTAVRDQAGLERAKRAAAKLLTS